MTLESLVNQGVVAKQLKPLQRFVSNQRLNMPDGLPCRLTDYLQLVDWIGRQIREDKRGSVDGDLPCIQTRLDIGEEQAYLHSMSVAQRLWSIGGRLSMKIS